MVEASSSATPRNWMTFLREFVASPRRTASIAPSGKQLGKLMVASLPAGARRVIELGAGTGAITDALIRHGIAPRDLFIVEMNPALHGLLQTRYRDAPMACGDACDLVKLSSGWRESRGAVDAVCSSLGMLAMPQDVREVIMEAAFAVMRPEGRFIQYTYGLACPIGATVRGNLNLDYRSIGFTWRNLPPARVFAYSRRC